MPNRKNIMDVFRRMSGRGKQGRSLSQTDRALIKRIHSKHLTYLSNVRLQSLMESCRRVNDQVPGMFIEAGCALGGSTIAIASAKPHARPLYVHDVFAMIPPPSAQDGADVHERYRIIREGQSSGIGGDTYYGYQEDLLAQVQMNLTAFGIDIARDNIFLVKGMVQDTLHIQQPVAFAHIDLDWYDPVKTCLERIMPQLSHGGIVVIDDYQSWSGCTRATDEFFKTYTEPVKMDKDAGSLRIIKV